MGFLAAFDQLNEAGLQEQATELLYSWIIHREKALYTELRTRPVLKFWSHHPGNPDFLSDDATRNDEERKSGWAYLLTSRQDVQDALDQLSMRPYEGWRRRKPSEPIETVSWVLSIDDLQSHKALRDAMKVSMYPVLSEMMTRAVQMQWNEFKANLNQIDARQYFRRVALTFTGEYFGIPASFIFEQAPKAVWEPLRMPSPTGIENLEQWSGEGYENFIWKIHARHFDNGYRPGPDRRYLTKISYLVGAMAENPIPDSVIDRVKNNPAIAEERRIVNIVGMIQGLVDNVMTSACIALNQIMAHDRVDAAARMSVEELVTELRALQRAHEAPSPFLPRYGSADGSRAPSTLLQRLPELEGQHIACAIGAALTDPAAPTDSPDIRLGHGMHECIGRELGDRLAACALQPLLRLGSLKVVKPLLKQWGWIPQQFVVSTLHPQRQTQVLIDQIANAAPPRPHPYSQWSSQSQGIESYASWPSLTDRQWFTRHLPPADAGYTQYLADSVPSAEVAKLFKRGAAMTPSRSTLLFTFFAQWLTDSFLRTDPLDRRRTTSNHHLDLCQIYGLDAQTTGLLRSHVNGKMKMDIGEDGKAYPPRLFAANGAIRPEFADLSYVRSRQIWQIMWDFGISAQMQPFLCASGLERGNSTVGYTALNTLFLREHNRVCDLLKAREGRTWSDEQLFQTARMIMILIEIKIIIEEYINHINTGIPTNRPFKFDPEYLFAERRRWYRTNWISVEFDLLYRWHSLIPNNIIFPGEGPRDSSTLRGDNRPLFELGLGAILQAASRQPAGRVKLFNTPDFLLPAERAAISMARDAKLLPFNEYRKRFGIPPMIEFKEFKDTDAASALQRIYGDIDKVEFLPGIIAEQSLDTQGSLFGTTMMTMVGHDAFTHALTNPLLSENVLTEQHLTATGLNIVKDTASLQDLLKRNDGTTGATFDLELP